MQTEKVVPMTSELFAYYYPVMQTQRLMTIYSDLYEFVHGWDPNEPILIPGFGRGGTMLDLKMMGFKEFFGFDLESAHIQTLQPFAHVLQADMLQFPFANDAFSYAVISDVFQDLSSREDVSRALRELARVVRDQIIFINPTPESYLADIYDFLCSGYPENVAATTQGMGASVRGKFRAHTAQGDLLLEFSDHVWTEKDFEAAFKEANLSLRAKRKPRPDVLESSPSMGSHWWVAPWVIYHLDVENKNFRD